MSVRRVAALKKREREREKERDRATERDGVKAQVEHISKKNT